MAARAVTVRSSGETRAEAMDHLAELPGHVPPNRAQIRKGAPPRLDQQLHDVVPLEGRPHGQRLPEGQAQRIQVGLRGGPAAGLQLRG